jgi:DNA-binding NtrC family response regulator
MIGESDKFLSALSTINKVAQYDHVVLVEGETGTGKELAARAVHYQGPRCNGPFVPLNCGLLNDTLLANELFGHRRGAYTDAADDHTGLIAQASGGSLFLDEVDALCARGQVSLLRVIEEKEFRPLGSSDSQIADIRILAASNRPLIELVEQGEFRADLYYRLSEVVIQMPPLRDRDQDVVLLARHFIDRCNRQWDREKSLSTSSIARLMNYGWPGNVRELQNLVNRQYLIQDEASIELDLPDSFSPSLAASPPVDLFDFAGTTFNEAKARILYEFEEYYLRWLLTQTGGNVTQAAKRAGKERRALGKLLKKHQIDRGDFDRRGHLSR